MKTQRTYQNQRSRRRDRRDRDAYGYHNEDRNTSYGRYSRDNNYQSPAWEYDYEGSRTYSRNYDDAYSRHDDRYDNRGGSYAGGEHPYHEGRNYDYDRQANYHYDDNDYAEYPDRNYGGSSYQTSRDENDEYRRNTRRSGPNRTYPPYGTDRYYGSTPHREIETAELEDDRDYHRDSSYGNRNGYRRSYSSRDNH